MKILLVEDNPDDLFFATRELIKCGHTVLGVDNGVKALAVFERERPDIVITDIYMPGMDGFSLTQAIQRAAAPAWQPVLFLSGQRDEALQVKALRVGADGYILKPVSGELLDARLKVIERLLGMQRQAEDHASELERYYAAEEDEKRIAEHLIRSLVNADKLDDPALQHRISPAALFSGDLIAAARTPGGVLHVLLADGTGRGLAASINVLPIVAPFYRMTEKGFGIDAIVREMNSKVRQFLPEGRFVAATMAAVNFRENFVQVWNGGNPEPFIISQAAHAEHVFSLRHLPLGVLADDEFEVTAETHSLAADAQMFLYSDGVVEAENAHGEMFGIERLAEAMINTAPERRLDAVVDAVTRHTGDRVPHDDIALLAVSFRPEAAGSLPLGPSVAATAAELGNWRFTLQLGAIELRKLDVVPLLLGLANQFEGAREISGELFVVLSELFNNSLDHGLLRLDSDLKLSPEGMDSYLEERQRRLSRMEEGEVELELAQLELEGRGWLRIVCRDTGPGFDYAAKLRHAPHISELPFGRGLALVRALASNLEFNEAGNMVSVTLALTPVAAK